MIYLDNAATTPIKAEVLETMMPYLNEYYGNASSVYELGRKSREAINHAREQIASVINAQPEEIYFTSGGTESNNWAVDLHETLTTNIEHPSILNSITGYLVNVNRDGIVETPAIEEELRKHETIIDFVSVMFANNEIGTIQPIAEIGKLCKEWNIGFHTDAVQAFGHVPIDVKAMNIDMLSASGHKIGGPKGIGFLYIREWSCVNPLIYGGHQERGMRAGTENVAGIVGMGAAAEIAQKTMAERAERERMLQHVIVERLRNEIPLTRINGTFDEKYRLPNNINVTFEGVDGESLVQLLDNVGICISAGSACTSESIEPSHVLKAIGLTDDQAHSTVRITLSDTLKVSDAHFTVDAIKKAVERLRKY